MLFGAVWIAKPLQKLLKVHRCSLLEAVTTSSNASLIMLAANSSVIDECCCTALSSSKMQNQRLLTILWLSVPACGNKCICFLFIYSVGHYLHVQKLWVCVPEIAELVRLIIVDAPLILTLKIYCQSLNTQKLYVEMREVSIDRQYIVSMKNYLNLTALKPVNIRSTTIHGTCAMQDWGPVHWSTFGWQHTVYRSVYWLLIYIAWHTHLFSTGSFCSSSFTYHTPFSKSRPYAPGLAGVWCTWLPDWMQQDGRRSPWLALRINSCGYGRHQNADVHVVT